MKVNEAWTKRRFLVVNMAYLGVTGKYLSEATGVSYVTVSFQCVGRVKVRDESIKVLREIGDTLEPTHFIDDVELLERSEEMRQLKSEQKAIEKRIRDIKMGVSVLK